MNKRQQAIYFLVTFAAVFFAVACQPDKPGFNFQEQGRNAPLFSADSAYHFIEDQVSAGPRVPGSEGHAEVKKFISKKLQVYAGKSNVYSQNFQRIVYGDTLSLTNFISSFGINHSDRIVLAAHWDTRPMAEKDPDDKDSPIPGADDGGSGVGVLLELARIFKDNPVPIGVDIIFFDGEDYGKPSDLEFYFLGSREWGSNPPVPGYNPRFGILLDMVGGEDAIFPKEGYSMQYAPSLVNEIWSVADKKGYGDLFADRRGAPISDDHIIVHRLTGIPMINIIHHRVSEEGKVIFPEYWHTQRDDLNIISKSTLQAVGDVLLELIYNRIPK